LSRFLNVSVSLISWRSEGRVFQAAGPQYEKPRSPNLVLVLGLCFNNNNSPTISNVP